MSRVLRPFALRPRRPPTSKRAEVPQRMLLAGRNGDALRSRVSV